MKKLGLGFLTLVALMLVSAVAFAQEGGAGGNSAGLIPIGVGLTLGVAAFGAAFGQGRAATAALEGIARNPAAAAKIQVPLIIALALMEGLVILSWLVANGLVGKIGAAH